MNSRFVPATVIYGRPATGIITTMFPTTIGCPARGYSRRKWASCGLHRGGAGTTARLFSPQDFGDRRSVSMAELITGSATSAPASTADAGKAGISSTTLRCGMWEKAFTTFTTPELTYGTI